MSSLKNVLCRRTPSPQDGSHFLSADDIAIVEDLKCFQNTPWQLFKVSLPCTITLAFCPFTLFLADPVINYFWPSEIFPTRPRVNDVISCFLTPAGLVYAIAFGFAFQEALGKQTFVTDKIARHLTLMEHLMVLCTRTNVLSVQQQRDVLRILKEDTVRWMYTVVYKTSKRTKRSDGEVYIAFVSVLICKSSLVTWTLTVNK